MTENESPLYGLLDYEAPLSSFNETSMNSCIFEKLSVCNATTNLSPISKKNCKKDSQPLVIDTFNHTISAESEII